MREEAEENKLQGDVFDATWNRWHTCSLCEQHYHGVVACALGWACWKTYVGRPEEDYARRGAINVLGNFLSTAEHHEDALSVREAELSMRRRLGDSEQNIFVVQSNLATTYHMLDRPEEANRMLKDVYSRRLRLYGEEHRSTIVAANNYASSLNRLQRHTEAKSVLRKMVPVARRILGEGHRLTLKMRWTYAMTLYQDDGATLDDLREAVETLEFVAPTWKRVFGPSHPETPLVHGALEEAHKALAARAS